MSTFSKAKFGITSDEDGLIVETISYNFKSDKAEYRDISGNIAGLTIYNPTADISLEGLIPKTAGFSGVIGGTLTLANSVPDHIDATGGSIIIESVDVSLSNSAHSKISIKATLYPYIEATV